MLRQKFYLATMMWALSCCIAACSNSGAQIDKDPSDKTTLSGTAPLNGGGRLRVLRNDQTVAIVPAIASDGKFSVQVGQTGGDYLVEVTGGAYNEAATGRRIRMGDETLHAWAFDVQAREQAQVIVTPWSELLYAHTRAKPGRLAHEEARGLLETALGCSDMGIVRAHPSKPSSGEPLTTANAAELSYIYLGGWSTLAKNVGERASKGSAAVTSVGLMRAIADTIFANGGRLAADVAVAEDVRLPPDVLRQQFAQATWTFLNSRPANVDIDAVSVKHLLACASSAPSSMWGPAGQQIDFFGPDVSLDAPDVVASATLMRCEAHDDSTVKSLTLQVTQNGKEVGSQATPGEDKTGLGTPHAVLLTTLEPAHLQDGNVALTCTSIDRWDNETSKTMAMSINRGQGKVTTNVSPIVERNGRAYVQGVVTVICACADPYPAGEDACGLSQASLATPGLGQPMREAGRASYPWDTKQSTDGMKNLICEGRSQGLTMPLKGSQYVWVGNYQPVRVVGEVHLDTLVNNMRVTAYAFHDARKGTVLGSAEAPNGEFALTISNEYAGPLLLEATPIDELGTAKASYKNLAFGETVRVDAHHLSLLWDHYSPAQGLPPVLHINAATTLAQSLAVGIYEKAVGSEDNDLANASSRAHAMVGTHLQPDGTLDPRVTAVADLVDRLASAAPNSIRMGLFHVGLSRLAAEKTENGPPFYSSLDLLAKLLEDASNGVFDGLAAGSGGELFLGDNYSLSTETLRRDLAAATKQWLQNDLLHGQRHAFSKLNLHAYSRSGQYLVTLAQNSSALFDGVKGQPFDEDGPEIQLLMREGGDGGKDWTDIPEGQVFRGAIHIDVRADDDSDVRDFDVMFGGINLVGGLHGVGKYALGTPQARGLFIVNSARFPDGDISILVTAHDRVGNTSELPMTITIDNSPPKIDMGPEFISQESGAVLRGSTDKPVQKVRAMHGRVEIGRFDADPSANDARHFAIPVRLPCNANSTLTLIATDLAGNESQPHDLLFRCDSSPPRIHWVSTNFQQEFSGQLVQLPGDVVLQKHMHRMGSRDNNLPTVRFYADDMAQGRIGSLPERIKVQYQFTMENHGRKRSTEWRDLEAVRDSAFADGLGYILQFSYENMLPSDVLHLDATSIRVMNYVARSTPEDLYTLTVRVSDEAGNIAQQDTKVRFDIKSTPVEINCQTYSFGELLENRALSPSHVAHLSAQGHRPLSLSATWKIPDAELAGASELAPSLRDVSIAVTLPTAYRQTQVEQTVRQLTVLKRITWISKGHEGEWCQDHGNSWARIWNTGECEAHMDSTKNESWRVNKAPRFVQRLIPDAPSIQVRGALAENMRIAYASHDSAPMEVASDVHGRQRAQYGYRTATEYERHVSWGNPDRVWLDERLFAEALNVQHTFSDASFSVDAFPAPSRLIYGPSCQKSWAFRG